MWLFGYGSLMWDGWETRYGCRQRVHAVAPEHRRVFNKKSLERWGTHAQPGLTLNLAPAHEEAHRCRGIAFEFPDEHQTEIEAYLSARETCHASEIAVRLPDEAVTARTYIYDGPRLIENGLTLQERAAMILVAEGIAGSSYDYIANVRAHLDRLGVNDPAVDELWHAVAAARNGDKYE
ncbi:cation transport protein chaC [Methyloceanibacter caenitepidi]|uniref:glutathione-specific gamma-glutamylcyclotransferase n=2 Tax=Methyloceanibacter caenitepidi TaxID=1384459 RepID=A0A0A8K2N8_9HYPH|nr:cation transport protein chaC [Methyloceanibacter caenitepidi]